MKSKSNLIERSFAIKKIGQESNTDQKTFFFDISSRGDIEVQPGQFYMLNYKGSQKPISVSHWNEGVIGFTVLKRGNMTANLLDNAKVGDFVGLTGPLGNSFTLDTASESVLIIGGGVGVAPVFHLREWFAKNTTTDVVALFGARTNSLLDFTKDNICSRDAVETKLYTDDDTGENQGFVTSQLEEILKNKKFSRAYMCGPEKMMLIASSIIKRVQPEMNIDISMERYMKCGIGICGSCVLDDIGLRVCADGPVFPYETLMKSREFGKYHRDSQGVIIE